MTFSSLKKQSYVFQLRGSGITFRTEGAHPAEILACKRSTNEKEPTILGAKTDTGTAEALSLALFCRQRNCSDCAALEKCL